MDEQDKQSKQNDQGNLDCLFRPRSVAVLGASTRKLTIGREVLHNLLQSEFAGVVYPVNSKHPVVHSLKAYPSVAEIPGEIDLAVVVIPGSQVLATAEECGRKGVKALAVISAGFKEIGAEGVERERELVAIARRHGMRILGPNCMGVINTDPAVSLNASFAGSTPIIGPAAFVSQSGALGEAILAQARSLGLGISMFASLGNRCDISASDLIEYWEHDENTRIILLYIESVGSPERFVRAARRVSREKPIIVVKAGRSRRGALAAASHTGSLAGRDQAFDALFEQSGIVRVETLKELFDVTRAFLCQPVPAGDRVAIVSNAGGPGILATDACEGHGLPFAEFCSATHAALEAVLPREASVVNPVDLIASADARTYDAVLRVVLDDPGVDALIVIFVSPVMIDAQAVARVIVERSRESAKPVVACLLGKQHDREAMDELRAGQIPVYRFPEEAARALAALCHYRERATRPECEPPALLFDAAAVRAAMARARIDERGWMELEDAMALLAAAGLRPVSYRIGASPGEALEAAHELGYPVVAKTVSTRILHKSDVGGVAVDLRNGDELFAAAREMLERARAVDPGSRLMIQPMVRSAHEVILGGIRDPQFGPLILFGLGGIFVEVMKDIAMRIAPLDERSVGEMVRSIRGFPILAGARGGHGVDFARLHHALLIVSQLFCEIEELVEMDLNPVMLGGTGKDGVVVDARMRLRVEP